MLFPDGVTCDTCGAELDGDALGGFCAACFSALPFNAGKTCFICGAAIGNLANYCNRCQNGVAFDAAKSPFIYDGEIESLIKAMKFAGKRYLAKGFAYFMAETLRAAWTGYDLVIPVPVHEKTLKKRGYNQAADLARELCKNMNEEELLREDLFVKIRYTDEQAQLGKVSRAENLAGAFAVTSKAAFKGKIVLLVDDVLTTGATANECAKTLKKAGAEGVYLLTLASTHYEPIIR